MILHGSSGQTGAFLCHLNAITAPPPSPKPVFVPPPPAGGARVGTTGVSSSRFALITGVSGKRPVSCLVSARLLLFLLDIILPAEQKGREEGNFNSTPEWRVSHNQCIQACNTACHRDSITWQQRGGGGGVGGEWDINSCE